MKCVGFLNSGYTAVLVCLVGINVSSLGVADETKTLAAVKPASETSETTTDYTNEQLEHARRTINTLDSVYKSIIVLVTDKYVQEEDDFAAGSAAVLLFKQMSEGGTHQVRLIDATGSPYEEANVASDAFEKAGLAEILKGKAQYEKVETVDGKPTLRIMTSVPVVHARCVMCHDHYKEAKPGEAIGALSYSILIH